MAKGGKKKGQKSESPKEDPPPLPPPEEVVEEEDGLGLGSSKRKQRKEKKQQQELARQSVIATVKPTPTPSREQSELPEEPPKEKSETETKIEEVVEEVDGLGLGGAKKKRPKKKKASDAPPAEPAQTAAAPAGDAPLRSSTATAVTSGTASPVAGQSSQLPSSASFPPPGFEPRTAVSDSSGVPVAAWGRGRGRGQGNGSAPGSAPGIATGPAPDSAPGPPPGPPRQIPISPSTPQKPQQISIPAQPQRSHTGTRPKGDYSQQNILCRYKIPTKVPGRTVNCKMQQIVINYLEMTFKPLNISRYDVTFTPDRPKKMIPEVYKKMKAQIYPNELMAFDQSKNCYSLRPLSNVPPNGRFNTMVDLADPNGRVIKFEVSLKATGVVELGNIKRYMNERGASVLHPTEEVQCIDVILRQGTLESYVKAGRQFFKRPGHPVDLGYGYEMWTGLFQSAIFTSKAFINIDVAHKGFPKQQPLLDALTKDFRLGTHTELEKQRPEYDITAFRNFVKGLKVIATIVGGPSAGQKREYICNAIIDTPDKVTFPLNDPNGGKPITTTVSQYYAKEKKYRIKYPNLNCVWVGPRDRTIYYPMELLEISYGQPLRRQLNEVQISKMVREAATPPDHRLQKITEVISHMKYSSNSDFKRFGLEISDKFHQVTAKILEAPVLDIGAGLKTVPRKGMWQANQLLKPEALLAWGFIAIECSPQNDYEGVIQMLVSTGKSMGMQISNPQYKNYNIYLTGLNAILRAAMDQGVKFVFIVVSPRGHDHYHKVKQMAEREIGMLTQCIKESTIRRMNNMTARNILLKVNSKLMGVNQALGDKTMPRCLRDGGVMIVGADVTHPSPEQSNVPSIAAVTASIDAKCYMYNIELSIQTPKKEMIVQFEDMMFDHLKVYKERNHQLPRKIFVFRDGVSEGQFVQVMNSELAAVHAAYARLAGPKKPEILFLLVQKRHHTRFFHKGEGCKNNVEPGTVVDTDIVHSSELDFYMVSHQAIKGTARPTRYHAVCNDGKIPDDEVEQLTFYLCHLYSRCMRSVSYPTPTYYAHLACIRARSLTHGQKFDNKELERQPERLHVLDKMLKYSRMFFV